MKRILILALVLSVLLSTMLSGTFSTFSDTEAQIGYAICSWEEEPCEEYECGPIVSDNNTMVTEFIRPVGNVTPVDPPENAELAWIHSNWSNIDYDFGDGPDDAQWIWETEFSVDPEDGRVVRFEREFCIPCDPESATLHITADNGYEVWINGNFVGSAQVFDYDGTDWEDSDLTENWVNNSGWQSVESYSINPAWLSTGRNVLEILAANEQMDGGTSTTNPAGVIYQLDLEYGDDCEYCGSHEECCAEFNVSDDDDNKIYQYDDTGTFVGLFDLSGDNGRPSGVASVGDYVYVLDQADKQVYQYTCCGTLVDVSRTLKKQSGSGLGNPYGLAIYGDDMWVVVWGQDFIMYHYLLSTAFTGTGNINADLQLAPHADNTQPTGLAVDADYLYVVDYDDKQVYRYPDTGGAATVSKVLKEVGGGDLDSPTGATLDGTSLWVVDGGTDKMYEYDLTDLFSGGGDINATSEFDLHADNEDATGV